MGITKKNGFASDIIVMSNVLKALGHPARLEILSYIKLNPNSTCMQIVNHIPLSQSTISKHLSELKTAKIILGVQHKNSTNYELNLNLFNDSSFFLNKFIENIENNDLNNSKFQSSQNEIILNSKITFKNLSELPTYKPKIKVKRSKEHYDLKKFNHVFKHLKRK